MAAKLIWLCIFVALIHQVAESNLFSRPPLTLLSAQSTFVFQKRNNTIAQEFSNLTPLVDSLDSEVYNKLYKPPQPLWSDKLYSNDKLYLSFSLLVIMLNPFVSLFVLHLFILSLTVSGRGMFHKNRLQKTSRSEEPKNSPETKGPKKHFSSLIQGGCKLNDVFPLARFFWMYPVSH